MDLAFTSTATYQMGLVVSKDSLSKDDDVIQPRINDDLRLFLENVHFLPVVLCSAQCSYSVKSTKSNPSD